MRVTLPVFLILLGSALAKEPDRPTKLLELAGKTQGKEARRLVNQAIVLLNEEKTARTQEEMNGLATRLAMTIEMCAHTPKDVQEIFGEKTAKTMVRQVFFRRYYEQWIYEKPVRIVVVFDCIKGKEAKLSKVFLPEREN